MECNCYFSAPPLVSGSLSAAQSVRPGLMEQTPLCCCWGGGSGGSTKVQLGKVLIGFDIFLLHFNTLIMQPFEPCWHLPHPVQCRDRPDPTLHHCGHVHTYLRPAQKVTINISRFVSMFGLSCVDNYLRYWMAYKRILIKSNKSTKKYQNPQKTPTKHQKDK